MALLTGTEVIAAVRQLIDDPNALLWSDANLTIHIGMTFDKLWGEILDWNAFYLTTNETITGSPKLVTPGYVDLSALAQRFNRLLSITRNGTMYDKARQGQVMIENNAAVVAPDSTYTFLGRQLWLFPLSITQQLEMRYNYLPAKFANSGSAITFPEGHEGALIWEAAATAMLKGEREANERLERQAEKFKYAMLASIGRPDNSPIIPFDLQSPTEWGGV
jgi:hypothetical protein